MKALRISLFVLCCLLVLCIGADMLMNRYSSGWIMQLETIQDAADHEDWHCVEQLLPQLEQDWAQRQDYLHITTRHSELDEAQELLDLCRLYTRRRDADELSAAITQLIGQLRMLAETEHLNIRNIL